MNKQITIAMLGILMIFLVATLFLGTPFVSAEIPSFESSEHIDLRHTITVNGSTNNVSANITVKDPQNDVIVAFEPMTFNSDSNDFNYTVNSNVTKDIGLYSYTVYAFSPEEDKAVDFNFRVTPSGQQPINSGEGLSFFGSLIVIIISAVLLFILAVASQGTITKVIFISSSFVMIMIAVLFSLVGLTQTLGGFNNIISGYTTFWFIIRIIASVGVTALTLFGLFKAWQMWQIKRGLKDEDGF